MYSIITFSFNLLSIILMNVVHVQIVDVLPHDKAASDHARRRMLLMTMTKNQSERSTVVT